MEEGLAEAQEAAEQRMHAVADRLGNPERVHQSADKLSERAGEHLRRAGEARGGPAEES
jgi:hypothetical protein